MRRDAKRRAELRPHGITNVPCQTCEFFRVCGGVQTARPLLDCFDETCCQKEDCDRFCPNNRNFIPLLRDVGGELEHPDGPPLKQAAIALPWYIPTIDHGYSRSGELDWPFVALDTYELFRIRDGHYRALADSPESLRAILRLSPTARIVLRGVADEPPLEEYWAYRSADRPAAQLAKLGVSLAVGPNYSMFLNVPRTDNVLNRRRQLICLDDMAEAGLSVVPHLGAIGPAHWKYWLNYLVQHADIRHVAKEFETGNRSPKEGRKAIREMANLQQSLGRALHPLLIGATQFVELAAKHFERFSVIDSTPFMKTMHRQGFDLDAEQGRWVKSPTDKRQPLDELLIENIARYSCHVERRVASAKSEPVARASLPSA